MRSFKDTGTVVSRIPPMTRDETIQFYADGKMPARLESREQALGRTILSNYGVEPDYNIVEGDDFEK